MRMAEWDEAGLRPLFGHQEAWLTGEIEEIGGVEMSAYAVSMPGGGLDRLLVATDLGLLDAERSEDPAGLTILAAALVPWRAVTDVRLRWDARLDASFRPRVRWRLEVGIPAIAIADPVHDAALLALWRTCVRGAAGELRPPKTE